MSEPAEPKLICKRCGREIIPFQVAVVDMEETACYHPACWEREKKERLRPLNPGPAGRGL